MPAGLTEKQDRAWRFIADHVRRHGYPPSMDEIMSGLRLRGKSSVHRLVHALRERGYVSMMPRRARSLEVLVWPDARGRCPTCGGPR